MTHLEKMQQEHTELAQSISRIQQADIAVKGHTTYTGPEGWSNDFSEWLANLTPAPDYDDMADWQGAQQMGFTFS